MAKQNKKPFGDDAQGRPNILIIFGDNIGIAEHQKKMRGPAPASGPTFSPERRQTPGQLSDKDQRLAASIE